MGTTCSTVEGTTTEPVTTQRLLSTDGERNDSNNEQIRAMSEQIVFLSTQNARLTQQLEETTQKARALQNQNQNPNQKQNENENEILNKHNIELFSYYEINFVMHKFKVKINKKKDRALPNSTATHIMSVFHINQNGHSDISIEKEKLLRDILDNIKDEIILELILRIVNNEEDSTNGFALKLLSKLILKKIIISWKTQQNTKIDLDFIYEVGRKMGEINVVDTANQIIDIIENEHHLTMQFNQLCDF